MDINKSFCLFLSNDKISLHNTDSSGNNVNLSFSNIHKSSKCTTIKWVRYDTKWKE